MKIFLLALLLTALTGGLAMAAEPCTGYSACAHSNSKGCRDARNAFAEHHNGMFPEQWCNQWYQGQRGHWNQHGNDWRWEGAEGDRYWKGPNGWEWKRHEQAHDH